MPALSDSCSKLSRMLMMSSSECQGAHGKQLAHMKHMCQLSHMVAVCLCRLMSHCACSALSNDAGSSAAHCIAPG